MIIAYEWISPIWWSCSLIRAHSHTRFDWECEILIVGVGVVRAWFPAQPFRTHNKDSHMWKHRNCTICVCVHDECCLISTIDSFNPALGVCVSWLDLTIIFFNFKYLFILHFFSLSTLFQFVRTLKIIFKLSIYQHAMFWGIMSSKRTMTKKNAKFYRICYGTSVYSKGGKMVSTYELRTIFLICIWLNFSRQFMRLLLSFHFGIQNVLQ